MITETNLIFLHMKHLYNFSSKVLLAIVMLWAGILTVNAQEGKSSKVVTGLTANEITANLMPGWNLGNTFDANSKSGLAAETSWGAPLTTREMIHAVKAAGFRSIRIPVSWATHVDFTDELDNEIEVEWIARVKEVVEWAIDEDLYVIINIHHDNNKQFYYPTELYKDQSLTYVKEVWMQVADAFAEFDQRLIFEALNEPRLVGTNKEWWFDPVNPGVVCLDAINIINESNQICVDETRSNGKGHNNERMVMCPGYAAAVVGCLTNYYKLPDDPMVAVSVHAYVPNALCLAGIQKTFSEDDDADIRDNVMIPIYEKFGANGIPVVIGEASCSNKLNLEARVQWVQSYYGYAQKYGMPVILWDNHEVGKVAGGENHGFLNRNDLTWTWPEFIDAIMEITGTGIENVVADNVKMFYVGNELTLMSETEISRCQIYNISGAVLKDFEVNSNYYSVNLNLADGAYLVTIETINGVSAKKLLVY